MKTQAQAQHEAIMERSKWGEQQRAIIYQTVQALAPLAVQDFRHQIGPRGCSISTGFREAVADADEVGAAIAEELKRAISDYIAENGIELD